MQNLEIQLLGGLNVRRDGAAVTGFNSSKVAALLAYLAVSGRPHQRDALAGLFWGEMADVAAANNLRQALTNLRKLFDPYLAVTRDTVAFDRTAPCFLDVESFSSLLRLSGGQPAGQRMGLLRQALALYHGDFLEGFYVRDAPDFEDWVLTQRVRLRELALQGWGDLTTLLLDGGDYPEAIRAVGRLLAMDPWREEAHRQRMLALARCGQRSAALAQYHACREILRREFDAEPSAETTALYDRVRAALRGPRHNLPARVTGFVGREAEMAELRRLVAAPNKRLVTILGPGGAGKTRLALELAASCEPAFLNGVWFVSLAAVDPNQPDGLAAAIADALHHPLVGSRSPRQQLIDLLRQRELLLVLDNLEHLLDSTPWFSELLVEAPEVKILATSRERLNLQAEQTFHLRGLALPGAAAPEPERSPAVQLFASRAERVHPDFSLDDDTLAAVVRICRLVEGLPLGVELAAAWVDQLSCDEIADEIAGSLNFLTTARRDVSPRQRSLRATFDWSWGRLTQEQQITLQRLAVFQGVFAREAAVEVAKASLPELSALVDKSLVWRRGTNYQLHEVVRHFAEEELRQAGEAETIRDRHALHYAGLLKESTLRLHGHQQKLALDALEREVDNLRAAWRRLTTQADGVGIAAATDGLYAWLILRSRFREGHTAFGAARLALEGGADRLTYNRAKAREGRFLASLSDFDPALALLHEALAELRQLDAPDEVAFVLNHVGGTARLRGDLETAEACLRECLALRQATGDLGGQAVAWLELAGVRFMEGDFAATRDVCRQGLAIAEAAGDLQTTAHLLTGLSLSLRELGQYEESKSCGRRGLGIYEELEDSYGLLQACLTLGELSRRMGDSQGARQLCQRAVALGQEIGDRSGEADGCYRLGQIAAGLGESEEALNQLRAALALAHEISLTPLILDTLLEIGCVLAGEGAAAARAAALLSFVRDQPQFAQRQRDRARARLAALPPATALRPLTMDEAVALGLSLRPGLHLASHHSDRA